MALTVFLNQLRDGQSLSADEARAAFDAIFMGAVDQAQMGGFLLALHDKGETRDEILGAALSMRSKALTIAAPEGSIDIVGTGGDGRDTVNISTAAALVVAGCGVPVAKHGNRAATSKSGSSDVLAALGVGLEPPLAALEQCLCEANLCFLFAPRHHPAMRHVAEARRKLGVRTIFNLLGPLTNPANVKNHLIGVYAAQWLRPMAETLQSLGSRSAWLTHGHDGLDEITTTTDSDVVRLRSGTVDAFTLSPSEANIAPAMIEQLRGGDAAHNAEALMQLLRGATGAYRDIVVLNAAAALVVAGKASDITRGAELAAQSLDSGAAYDCLSKLIEITNRASS